MTDPFAENAPSSVSPHALYPVIAGFLETVLNQLLYREAVLKQARVRLTGKTLALCLAEPEMQFTLIFSEKQLDVISRWEDSADCVLQTRFMTLLKLRDKQQLSALIRSGDITIDGDMQVIQHFSALLDMAEWDPAHYLAPYLGDVAAQTLTQIAAKGGQFIRNAVCRQKDYLSGAVTREWALAPSALEAAHFCDEVSSAAQAAAELDVRLSRLEKRAGTGHETE